MPAPSLQFRILFYSHNLGQNKWNIWTTLASPHFNDAKMALICSFAPSSLLWGNGRSLVHFILSKIV